MAKPRIHKNDIVQIIAGKGTGARNASGGRRGKVLEVDAGAGRAKVQGLRMVFRHQKQSRDPNRPGGGRTEREGTIELSNLMIVCPKCDRPTRIGMRLEARSAAGGKEKTRRVRVCKKCKADVPTA
jgi:large subunit ribosomal protein L24